MNIYHFSIKSSSRYTLKARQLQLQLFTFSQQYGSKTSQNIQLKIVFTKLHLELRVCLGLRQNPGDNSVFNSPFQREPFW